MSMRLSSRIGKLSFMTRDISTLDFYLYLRRLSPKQSTTKMVILLFRALSPPVVYHVRPFCRGFRSGMKETIHGSERKGDPILSLASELHGMCTFYIMRAFKFYIQISL
jgi:hypothetical protein